VTTPHTPPAALPDVAAIEARAAAATAATARVARVITSPRRERGEVVRVKRESDVATHESAADVPTLLAALRTLAAQHAADVAAAVAGERARCALMCDAAAARWKTRAAGEAVSSDSRRERGNEAAALAAEIRALAAPTGGGE